MTKFTFGCLIMAILIAISGCGESYYFDSKRDISNGVWQYKDSLDFEVDIQDTVQFYSLLLDINHSVGYKTQNLYVYINTEMPDGVRLGKRLNIDMAAPTGEWYGDCGRQNCEISINLQKKAYFNQLGKHKFTIKQYMRQDSLLGINGITLKMKEINQE